MNFSGLSTAELGQHHAVEVEALVELARRVHGVLSRHGIDHEERLGGFHGGFHGRDLLHHRLVHGQTARRIDDHRIERLLTRITHGILGDLHRIAVALLGVDLHADLTAQHLQLVDGRRTVDVARHEQHLTALFALEERSQLAREGSLTRTLQTRDEHHGGRAVQTDVGGRAAHERGQFVAHDLGHHLPGLDRAQHVLPQGLLLHLIGERLGYLVIDVGVDQRTADLLERLGDVDFGNAAFALEEPERPFELIG